MQCSIPYDLILTMIPTWLFRYDCRQCKVEYIADNHGRALNIPAKLDAQWSVGELNNILHENLVPCGVKGGHLRTFGMIEWECDLYRGRTRARCYPFNIDGHRFRGKTVQVCHHTCHILYYIWRLIVYHEAYCIVYYIWHFIVYHDTYKIIPYIILHWLTYSVSQDISCNMLFWKSWFCLPYSSAGLCLPCGPISKQSSTTLGIRCAQGYGLDRHWFSVVCETPAVLQLHSLSYGLCYGQVHP